MTIKELFKKADNVKAKCSNDFELDTNTFAMWSGKRQDLIKDIKLQNNCLLRCTLMYCYDKTIALHIDLMKPVSDPASRVVMYSKSSIYSDNDRIKHDKKDMKLLYKYTESFDNNIILSLAQENCRDWLRDALVLA